MNAKLAKALRGAARYRNQSATPGTMAFPGIARLYKHPVYETRQTTRTEYVHAGRGRYVKREYTVTRIAVNNHGSPILAPLAIDWDPKSPTYGQYAPQTALVPATKPARLDPRQPKGVYRALKKLSAKNVLAALGQSIVASRQPKEVTN